MLILSSAVDHPIKWKGQKISFAVTENWGLGFERDGFLVAGSRMHSTMRTVSCSGMGPRRITDEAGMSKGKDGVRILFGGRV